MSCTEDPTLTALMAGRHAYALAEADALIAEAGK